MASRGVVVAMVIMCAWTLCCATDYSNSIGQAEGWGNSERGCSERLLSLEEDFSALLKERDALLEEREALYAQISNLRAEELSIRENVIKKLRSSMVPREACMHAGAAGEFHNSHAPHHEYERPSLSDLMMAAGTDKVYLHGYHRFYESLLAPLRLKHGLRMLEIGVQSGRSMKTWAKYFENAASIQGVEKREDSTHGMKKEEDLMTFSCHKEHVPGCEKMQIFNGDQSDIEFLKVVIRQGAGLDPAALMRTLDSPDWDQSGWDLIIDDGSHVPRHQLVSFAALFPFVRPGGLYVIEDVETSYLDHPQAHVYGYKLEGAGLGKSPPGNFVEKMKQLVDVINREWFYHSNFSILGPAVDQCIRSITFAGGMLWVQKSFASDEGYPFKPPFVGAFRDVTHGGASEAIAKRMREVEMEEAVAQLNLYAANQT